jgi:hypothetical protein
MGFYRELTQAQLQQVTDRVPYRNRQGMVPDLVFHGLGGTSAQYYELKRLRASKDTGVPKRAATVHRSSTYASCASWIRSSTEPTLIPPLPQVLCSCGAFGH